MRPAGLLEGNLVLVFSVAVTEMTAVVNCELAIRLGIAFVKALAIVIAYKAALRERAETAMLDRVQPPFNQSVIESLPLFEQLPASVYAAVVVTVERPQTLSENTRVVDGADYERRAKNE